MTEQDPIYVDGHRFRVFDVPKDGNCVFHAFEYAIQQSVGCIYKTLRKDVVRYMPNHWDYLRELTDHGNGFPYPSLQAYVAAMSKNKTWAGPAELALLAIEYDRRVRIFKNDEAVALFNPEGQLAADVLFVQEENHYKCLIEDDIDDPTPPAPASDPNVIYEDIRHAFPETNYDSNRSDLRNVAPYDYEDDMFAGELPASFPFGSSKSRSVPVEDPPATFERRSSLELNSNMGTYYMWAGVFKGETVHGTKQVTLGDMTLQCPEENCGALFWEAERLVVGDEVPAWCCGKEVKCMLKPDARFKPINDPVVRELYTGTSNNALHFQEHIIDYNNALSCAIPVTNYDSRRVTHGRIICVNGRVTFQFDTGISDDLVAGQLYFAELTTAVIDARVARAQSTLRPDVMTILERYLRSQNDLVKTFEIAANLQRNNPTERVTLLVNPHRDGFRTTDREYLGKDQRAFRPQGSRFVAAAFIGRRIDYSYDVALFPKGVTGNAVPSRMIHEASPSLDALLYPLIHLHSEDPWVEVVKERKREKRVKRQFKSALCGTHREYYSSRIMIRPDDQGVLFRSRSLFQQWLCDAAAKIEDNNLNYAEANQEELQVCQLDSLRRFVAEEAENVGKRPGRVVILPPNVQVSERAMYNNYLDSISISMNKGPPTLLWTFTTNPRWPEIRRALRLRNLGVDDYFQVADVVVRAYLARLGIALSDVVHRGFFGRVLGYSGVHEFQSTMLPHFHLAVILDPADVPSTPDDVDAILCAEIPCQETETDVFYYVMKHMIHKPCDGSCPDNPNPMCRPDGGPCKSGFPFDFRQDTIMTKKGALLRRRETAPVWSIKFKCYVDNRWVVPYSPKMGIRSDNHLNVMLCGPNTCYKYLYGYFTKESRGQCVQGGMLKYFRENNKGETMDWDEIKHFQDLRVIGPFEAVMKILAVPMARLSHSVIRLPVHLPGKEYVYYRGDFRAASARGGSSKLEGWFHLNNTNPAANHLLYSQVVTQFKWEEGSWIPKTTANTLGRLMHVNPSPRNMELFFLRLLLLNRPGMKSWKDILTVDGVQHNTFEKACKALGLGETGQIDYASALDEVAAHAAPYLIRSFFATIIATGLLDDAESLWVQYRRQMSMDFIRRGCGFRESYIRARREILRLIDDIVGDQGIVNYADPDDSFVLGGTQGRVDLLVPITDFSDSTEDEVEEDCPGEDEFVEPLEDPNRSHQETESENMNALRRSYEEHTSKYTAEQKLVHETVMTAVDNQDNGQCNFYSLVAPAGCGKTYVYKGIVMDCKIRNVPVTSCAMTALAALLLIDGDTCHKTFGIPVRARQDGTERSFLERTSVEAQKLANSKLILIDEVSMLSRWQVILIDQLLRDLTNRPEIPFGGKVILFGGDMGQILPVIRNASSSELISNSLPAWKHWNERKELLLTVNLRASEDANFARWIMKVRDGSANIPGTDFIRINKPMLVTTLRSAKSDTVGEQKTGARTPDEYKHGCALSKLIYPDFELKTLQSGIIVSPTNDSNRFMNNVAVQQMPSPVPLKSYLGKTDIVYQDRAENNEAQLGEFIMTYEELQNINAPNLPPHRLDLKVGCVVMLLINLNKKEGLCNGARFVVEELLNHAICLRRLVPFNGRRDTIYLPKMRMRSDDVPVAGSIQRFQFPITLAFAVTINKSQGQSFDRVGIFLSRNVFTHGQFYVAVGRARKEDNVHIVVMRSGSQGPYGKFVGGRGAYMDVRTKNIVYREVLQ